MSPTSPGRAPTDGPRSRHRSRRTVTDYLWAPRYRSREELPRPHGERVTVSNGASVEMAIQLDEGLVTRVSFRASSCATLVAYAEVLGDLLIGQPASEAARTTPEMLISALPGVPSARWDRATAVVHAAWSAIAVAMRQHGTEEVVD